MTEVRWFLSIQFSKSLDPWRAYQSRTLGSRCQALFDVLTGPEQPPRECGERNHTEGGTDCQAPRANFFEQHVKYPETSPLTSIGRVKSASGTRGKKRKDGGRVPRQGRHVLDGTLDRMEGASLRGPETLPPWNLVFKWSDTARYHSWGPEAFPPCTSIMERKASTHNPSIRGISLVNRNCSCFIPKFVRVQPKTTRRAQTRHGLTRSARIASG
jgi:hypothetical protein